MPKLIKYTAKQPTDAFPAVPNEFTMNRVGLLQALHEASEVTDADSHRFALGCLQLSKDGNINATDGRQLLVQQGFNFPWTEVYCVLAARSSIRRNSTGSARERGSKWRLGSIADRQMDNLSAGRDKRHVS